MRWNGSTWTQLPCTTPNDGELLGVTAISANQAWLTGYTTENNGRRAIAMHWNGTTCQTLLSHNPYAVQFNDAIAISNGILFAGYATHDGTETADIEMSDGRSLTPTTIPNAPADDQYPASGATDIAAEPGTRDRMWSVGWQLTGPTTQQQQPAILRND